MLSLTLNDRVELGSCVYDIKFGFIGTLHLAEGGLLLDIASVQRVSNSSKLLKTTRVASTSCLCLVILPLELYLLILLSELTDKLGLLIILSLNLQVSNARWH